MLHPVNQVLLPLGYVCFITLILGITAGQNYRDNEDVIHFNEIS